MTVRPGTDGLAALFVDLVGDRAGRWDRAGRLPEDVLRKLGAAGALCAQVPAGSGGPGLSSVDNGRLTAAAGALCSSVRSIMTSQGIAAWTVGRHADPAGREPLLRKLCGGTLAAVALSEPQAGSDLSAMATEIRADGSGIVVSGHKVWVTGAAYADLLLVFGTDGTGGGAVAAVPRDAPGVTVTPVADPLGCRAAGHSTVELAGVRLDADHLICTGIPVSWLVASAMSYGRLSVAWGCVGILRACREEAARHARTRRQFGTALAGHQLVARHLAELWTGEQVATHACTHASRCWDGGSVEAVSATVLAKYVSAREAARGAATAVQVLASAGAEDGHRVARAYRDAKLMEIIEGSAEICQLLLAEHASTVTADQETQ
jgi:methoxymalonate biosynthesis protein